MEQAWETPFLINMIVQIKRKKLKNFKMPMNFVTDKSQKGWIFLARSQPKHIYLNFKPLPIGLEFMR